MSGFQGNEFSKSKVLFKEKFSLVATSVFYVLNNVSFCPKVFIYRLLSVRLSLLFSYLNNGNRTEWSPIRSVIESYANST